MPEQTKKSDSDLSKPVVRGDSSLSKPQPKGNSRLVEHESTAAEKARDRKSAREVEKIFKKEIEAEESKREAETAFAKEIDRERHPIKASRLADAIAPDFEKLKKQMSGHPQGQEHKGDPYAGHTRQGNDHSQSKSGGKQ